MKREAEKDAVDEALLAALRERARHRNEVASEMNELHAPESFRAAADRIADAIQAQDEREKRRSRRWATMGAPLAVAAAIALSFRYAHTATDAAPLDTPYAVEISGHVAEHRGAGAVAVATLERRRGSIQEITVRPEHTPRSLPEVTAFAVRGGAPSKLKVPVEVASEGSARFSLTGGQLEGVDEVRILISSAGSNEKDVDAVLHSGRELSPGATVLSVPVTGE